MLLLEKKYQLLGHIDYVREDFHGKVELFKGSKDGTRCECEQFESYYKNRSLLTRLVTFSAAEDARLS